MIDAWGNEVDIPRDVQDEIKLARKMIENWPAYGCQAMANELRRIIELLEDSYEQ